MILASPIPVALIVNELPLIEAETLDALVTLYLFKTPFASFIVTDCPKGKVDGNLKLGLL